MPWYRTLDIVADLILFVYWCAAVAFLLAIRLTFLAAAVILVGVAWVVAYVATRVRERRQA